jgi:hypothetical protein
MTHDVMTQKTAIRNSNLVEINYVFCCIIVMVARSGEIRQHTATGQLFVLEAMDVIIDDNRYAFAVQGGANFRMANVILTSLCALIQAFSLVADPNTPHIYIVAYS